jgi:nucleotide-binding universal stress UspA family protein
LFPQHDPAVDGDPFPNLEDYQRALDKTAASALEGLEPRFAVPVVRELSRRSDPVGAILSYVERAEIDVVVVGTHGRSGLPHVLLGSVAQRVVRLSPVSVLVVGRSESHRLHKAAYERIVCGVDFSEPSQRALGEAIYVARRHLAHLTVTYVVEPLPQLLRQLAPAWEPNREVLVEDLRQRAEAGLRDELTSADDVPYEILIGQGRPHEGILEAARAHQADLIVVGTAGAGGADRRFVGSVTGKVLRMAPCPVLVVKSADRLNV